MKPTPSPQDEEIIKLLKSLETLKAEYPSELLAARRAAFIAQIEQQKVVGEKQEDVSAQDPVLDILNGLKPLAVDYPSELLAARRAAFIAQIEQQKAVGKKQEDVSAQDPVLDILNGLKPLAADYPSELLAARRAAFVAQIREQNLEELPEEAPTLDQVINVLESLQPAAAVYPPDLLAARRSTFIAQIERRNGAGASVDAEPVLSQNGKIHRFFERLKALETEYPLKLWAARRSAFVRQIRDGRTSVLDVLRSTFRNLLYGRGSPLSALHLRRASMILAGLLVAAFMGSLLYGNRQPLTGLLGPAFSEREGSHPGAIAATSTEEVAEVICKDGYLPPLCLAQEFDQTQDLTFPGNGAARPAVAKDTIPGHSRIHKAAYVNDGLYGPGASWVSNSPYSWIKIDLGEVRTINTITFGRDRLGKFNDGDPGQFLIAVALSDNIYADGNSSNDLMEYTQVYNSKTVGFDGIVSGPETVQASFDPVIARFVKITFENAGTAVDEVEVFMIQPPGFAGNLTQKPREDDPLAAFTFAPTNTLIPTNTSTPIRPSSTPVPTDTPTAAPTLTPAPTDTSTPEPTRTHTPEPTLTPRPTRTPTPEPTNTPRPTRTHTPEPTNTPRPTRTHTPEPTNTTRPTDTDTPEPTNTPRPPDTDTPEPTNTPRPPDTDTPEPIVTDTAQPIIPQTETPLFPTGP